MRSPVRPADRRRGARAVAGVVEGAARSTVRCGTLGSQGRVSIGVAQMIRAGGRVHGDAILLGLPPRRYLGDQRESPPLADGEGTEPVRERPIRPDHEAGAVGRPRRGDGVGGVPSVAGPRDLGPDPTAWATACASNSRPTAARIRELPALVAEVFVIGTGGNIARPAPRRKR